MRGCLASPLVLVPTVVVTLALLVPDRAPGFIRDIAAFLVLGGLVSNAFYGVTVGMLVRSRGVMWLGAAAFVGMLGLRLLYFTPSILFDQSGLFAPWSGYLAWLVLAGLLCGYALFHVVVVVVAQVAGRARFVDPIEATRPALNPGVTVDPA